MQKSNLTTIEGRNAVLESLKQGRNIKKVVIESSAKGDKINKIKTEAKNRKVQVRLESTAFFKSSATSEDHQGVIAFADPIKTISSSQFLKNNTSNNNCVVLLRSLDYEHNLGAILRTAASSGVAAVVVPKTRKSAITPTVERVSMGGVFEVSIIEESFFSALSVFKKGGYKLVGLEVNGTTEYFNEDYSGNIAFVIGSESETLSDDIENKLDCVVKIPMYSNISSLNVSVSTGILLYERVRQLNKNNGKIAN